MKIVKRIIPILTIFVLVVGMFSFPVGAVESNLDKDVYVDLLTAASYGEWIQGTYNRELADPYNYVSDVSYYGISWNFSFPVAGFSKCFITIFAEKLPLELNIVLANGDSSKDYSAKYIGSSGYTHQYSFYVYESNINAISVSANWGNSYSGNFGILSLNGCIDTVDVIENASYRFRYRTFGENSIKYTTLSYGSRYALPVGDTVYGYYPNDTLCDGDLFVWVPADQRAYQYADSISFLVMTLGPLIDYDVALVDANTTVLTVLESKAFETQSASLTVHNFEWPINFYKITADLSGYDLSGTMIQLYVQADSVYYGTDSDYEMVSITCEGISIIPSYSETPWYKIFYNWINGSLNDPEADSDADQIVSDSDKQSLQAGVIKDKMDSVDRPDPGSVAGSLDVGGIVSASSAPLVMGAIIGDSSGFVTTVLILVFTFALIGFVFFGKR